MKTCSFVLAIVFLLVIRLEAQEVAAIKSSEVVMKERNNTETAFIPNVEIRTSFVGGLAQLSQFLEDNLTYPTLANINAIEGTVLIEFTVAADGSVQKAKVIEGIGFGLDEEALRVVNLMPKWNPAQQGRKAVASKVRVPIQFSL
ncbi:MAG: energy transducer TonB [Bacteroidota bacterium]